ncbi:MAG TPA: hypothetical protein VLC98_05445 [Phnomibacter sp.]|nr:hypothetical protein [Phnomibacter sp.]
MWTSTNFKTYQKQFDFTSSAQGMPTYTALKIDDTDFINIIEGLDGEIEEDQIFQTILCSSCGIYNCEPGNWVALRQSNDFVFFIPAFEELHGEQNQTEYAPPYWFRQKGSFWLTKTDFEKFKKLIPELYKQKSINRITKSELLALYKSETPHKMFGDFPDFKPLRKNHVLVVSELDNETAFEIIESKLKELELSAAFEITPLKEDDKVISVFLDDSSTTEWKALCKTENNYELLLGGTFKVIAK